MIGRRNAALIAAITVLAAPPAARSQAADRETIRLVGRVFDEIYRPIVGVEVLLNRRDLGAVTNENGFFTLQLARLDSTIAFRRIGFTPLLLTLDQLPGPGDTVLVEMRRSTATLPELIATGTPSKPLRYAGTSKYDRVFERLRLGLGTLVPRDAIDARVGSSTAQLLESVPGVHYFDGPPKRLKLARCSEPGGVTVFVDGFRQVPALLIRESPEIEILSRIHPASIEMIEVFRGVSQIPGEFHWNGCAVIAIWLRWNS